MFFPSKKRNRVKAYLLPIGTHASITVPEGSRYLDALVVDADGAGEFGYPSCIMIYAQAGDSQGDEETWRFRLLAPDEGFEDYDQYATHLKALSISTFGTAQVYQLYRQSRFDD